MRTLAEVEELITIVYDKLHRTGIYEGDRKLRESEIDDICKTINELVEEKIVLEMKIKPVTKKTYSISDKKAFIHLKKECEAWKKQLADYKKNVQVIDEPMFF